MGLSGSWRDSGGHEADREGLWQASRSLRMEPRDQRLVVTSVVWCGPNFIIAFGDRFSDTSLW